MTNPLIEDSTPSQLTQLAQTLYAAIDSGDRAQTLSAQQALSTQAAAIWSMVNQKEVAGRDKAMARLLADMAIQDPANYLRIQHELRLLRNSLVLLK